MKIALMLITMLLFVSCGSENNTSSSSSTSSPVVTPTNQFVSEYQSTYSFSDFQARVVSGKFVDPDYYFGREYSNYVAEMRNLSGSCSISYYGVLMNTRTDGSLFYRRLQNEVPRYYLSDSSAALTNYSDIIALLGDIVSDARMVMRSVGPAAFEFVTNDDVVYIIDLNIPVIANPRQAFDCNSDVGFILGPVYPF